LIAAFAFLTRGARAGRSARACHRRRRGALIRSLQPHIYAADFFAHRRLRRESKRPLSTRLSGHGL